MDEGDRRAPIALARNAPVAQAPHGRALAPALMFGARDDRGFGFVDRHAVEEVAVHELAGAGIGFGPCEMLCDLVAVGYRSEKSGEGKEGVRRCRTRRWG